MPHADDTEGHTDGARARGDQGARAQGDQPQSAQGLVRLLEEAPGSGGVDAAVSAAREFLRRTPHQDVCVSLARLLAREDRGEEAMAALRKVWEVRTGRRQPAGRIETVARELDPDADLSGWSPEWPPPDAEPPAPEHDTSRVAPQAAGPEDAEPPAEPPAAGREETADEGASPARLRDAPSGTSEPPAPGASRPSAGARAGGRGPAGPPGGGGGGGGGGGSGGPDGAGSPGEAGRGEDLRRGLRLVEELLEVAPDNPELWRRKAEYGRRLDDQDVLAEGLTGLGRLLAERGSGRAADLVLREVLERVDPGRSAAEEALRRVARPPWEPDASGARGLPVAPGAPEDGGEPAEGTRTESVPAVDRRFRRRLAAALEAAPRELGWLHAAARRERESAGGPPAGAHACLGRWLLARGRPRQAADHLGRAVEQLEAAGDDARADGGIADLLYDLGTAWRQAGLLDRGDACFRRLARVDRDFRLALQAVAAEVPAEEGG